MTPHWQQTSCLILVATLLAGGGGSHRSTSASARTPVSKAAAARSSAPSGIRARVLASNELAGFTSSGVSVFATAQKWLSNPNDQQSEAQAAAERAMLTSQGFKAGAVENLTGPAPDAGLSIVEQFRSATAARAALAFYVSGFKNPKVQSADGTYASFPVPGVPGAVGFTLGGTSGGANIAFARGAYYYLVGREGGTRADRAGLAAAARHLYRRMGR